MANPATAGRWSGGTSQGAHGSHVGMPGELHRESRSEWAQDAIDVLAIAAVLLLVAFIAFL
jgi:hypothetical protein